MPSCRQQGYKGEGVVAGRGFINIVGTRTLKSGIYSTYILDFKVAYYTAEMKTVGNKIRI